VEARGGVAAEDQEEHLENTITSVRNHVTQTRGSDTQAATPTANAAASQSYTYTNTVTNFS